MSTEETIEAVETPTDVDVEVVADAGPEEAMETQTETDVEPEPEVDLAPPASTNGSSTVHRPGSLPNWWTDAYPQVTDVANATAYLDRIGGAMSRAQEDGRWVLTTGAQTLFVADTPEELDGFVLGFALSQLIAERHGPISQARRN